MELAENPNHRRSKLVRLTVNGKGLVNAMVASENAALSSLELAVPAAEIRRAADVLRALRQSLQDSPWARGKGKARLQGRVRK